MFYLTVNPFSCNISATLITISERCLPSVTFKSVLTQYGTRQNTLRHSGKTNNTKHKKKPNNDHDGFDEVGNKSSQFPDDQLSFL
ncbi:hypothetical protein [Flavobacterium sp. FlaQc-48]|uniref:hypothetical protein n=1 Tax=Flavobacterium sp. FlaQc-48 TaxID=3374181 RepID=UPI0037571283